ncbi:MAG: ATP-binding protein [Acidimicrobiia bacterium]
MGREVELAILHGMLDDAAGGHGRVTVLEGEAGIGKSRLVAEAAARAEVRAFHVLRGSADELDDRSFGPLAEALGLEPGSSEPDRAEIGRLLVGAEAGAPSDPAERAGDLRYRIVESVLALLERLSSTRPVLLVVEDLHWADPSTVRAVRTIARSIAQSPVALVLTARPFPRSAEVGLVIGELRAGGDDIALAPVDEHDVWSLASALAGAWPGPRLRGQLAGAGGNPLFVIELLKALRDEDVLRVADGHADAGDGSLPPSLALTVLRRISFMPQRTLEVLKVASILGPRFALDHLAALMGRSPVQLVGALEAAVQAGLLGEVGPELAFRHDLIREAIYLDLPLPLRQGLHREAARVLEAIGVPLPMVTEHLVLGASTGDRRAVDALARAARQAAPRSPTTAVRLFEHARGITLAGDGVADELASELAPLLIQTGRVADAEHLTRQILASGTSSSVEVALRRALGEALWTRGLVEAAIAELEAAAAVEAVQTAEGAGALALAAHLKLFLGRVDEAEEQSRRAAEDGRRLGDDFSVCLGLQTEAIVAHARGHVPRAVSRAEAAVAAAGRSRQSRVGHLHPHLYLGLALIDADRLVDAEAVLQAGRARAEERGTVAWMPLYHWVLAVKRIIVGEWDDSLAECEVGIGVAEEVGCGLHVPFLYGVGVVIHLNRDDMTTARRRQEQAMAEFLSTTSATWQAEAARDVRAAGANWPFEWGLWIDAQMREVDGDPTGALAAMTDAWALGAPLRYLMAHRFLGPDLVRLAVAAGETMRAEAVTAELELGARRAGTATSTGTALRCRGLVARDPELLLEAVECYRQAPGAVVEGALAAEDAAAVLGRVGRSDKAVTLLDEAMKVYEALGASRPMARTEAALRALGVRRRRSGAKRRPALGWTALTGTELTVARLTAEGLTNRQVGERLFVSRRTVETHLAHVFQKLGLSSRAQLAVEVARRTTPS